MSAIDTAHCAGCRDDFYNRNVQGGCWSRANAKLVTRYRTGIWNNPTEKGAFVEMQVPDCYRQQGYSFTERLPAFVKAEDVIRPRGDR